MELDAPVVQYVPAFGANGKEAITVRQLPTHTSGLPDGLELWLLEPSPEERLRRVLEVAPERRPDTRYVYSDLVVALLTNGVHPTRDGPPVDGTRQAVANVALTVADA